MYQDSSLYLEIRVYQEISLLCLHWTIVYYVSLKECINFEFSINQIIIYLDLFSYSPFTIFYIYFENCYAELGLKWAILDDGGLFLGWIYNLKFSWVWCGLVLRIMVSGWVGLEISFNCWVGLGLVWRSLGFGWVGV